MGCPRLGGAIVAVLLAAILAPCVGAEPLPPLQLDGPATPQPWKRYADWNPMKWQNFNTLANPKATPPKGHEIVVGEVAGDPAVGEKLAFERSRGGGCLACHVMGPRTQPLPGSVGPDLSEIGNAGRTDQWLYNYVFDPRIYNPQSVMPPWGRHGFYSDPEIRDIVAFLKALKTPAMFSDPLDDPDKRPPPVENRDYHDPFVNPAIDHVENGARLFKRTAANGKACSSCHATPEKSFKRFAAEMPRWEPRLKKVLGVEEFIARHARATLAVDWSMEWAGNIDLSAWLHSLADGETIKVDLFSPEARAAFGRGEALANLKIGQFDFSCSDCHGLGAGKWLRGQWLGPPAGQYDHFPVWRTSRDEVWDIRRRFQWCNLQVRADELSPDAVEYGELELYLRKMNEGRKLAAPNIRH